MRIDANLKIPSESEPHVQSAPSTPLSISPLPPTIVSATQSASSDAATLQHESLRGELWNKAYDGRKDKEAELVEAYEKLLSRELGQETQVDSPADNSINLIRSKNSEARKLQMEQIVRYGLKKTEREASVKSGIEEKTRVLSSMKDLISQAVKSSPEASLAWTGVCFCMQVSFYGLLFYVFDNCLRFQRY